VGHRQPRLQNGRRSTANLASNVFSPAVVRYAAIVNRTDRAVPDLLGTDGDTSSCSTTSTDGWLAIYLGHPADRRSVRSLR
jgi:hypothetical protein